MLEQKKLDEFLQVINENLKELREKKKEVDQAFGRMLQKLIIQLLQTDEEMQFLKDSTEWEAWTNI